MSAFPDLDELFDPTLTLPIRGVDYVIEPPSVVDILKLRLNFADPESNSASALDRLIWQVKVLGGTLDVKTGDVTAPDDSVWAQMQADGVSGEEILRAGNTALLRFGINPEVAEFAWGAPLDGGDGEGKGPGSNRKSRRAAPRKRATKKAS